MSRFLYLAATCVAALSLSVVPAELQAQCPKDIASVPLRMLQRSLIVAPVMVNGGGPFDFVVDTGAQITTVDVSLAAELRLRMEGTTSVGGVATQGRMEFTYLDEVRAGAHAASRTLAVVEDLAQFKAADGKIRGILGENFLEQFDLLIDYPRHVMCLDDQGRLAGAVKSEHKGERIVLAESYGSQKDLPFTRPPVVSVSLPGIQSAPLLLRLDSGSNAPLLYGAKAGAPKRVAAASLLKRTVDGVEQAFAVLPEESLEVGGRPVGRVSFVTPVNAVGQGASPREDGVLPTIAFQRVFISFSGRYAVLEAW